MVCPGSKSKNAYDSKYFSQKACLFLCLAIFSNYFHEMISIFTCNPLSVETDFALIRDRKSKWTSDRMTDHPVYGSKMTQNNDSGKFLP